MLNWERGRVGSHTYLASSPEREREPDRDEEEKEIVRGAKQSWGDREISPNDSQ